MNIYRDRVIASMLLSAIGDALGAPIEGLSLAKRKAFGRVETYMSNSQHPWNGNLRPGQWTDDTQLMLVVAESLIASGGRINMDDMAARHVVALDDAQRDGIGWGRTTTLVIERLKSGVHWSNSGENLGEGYGAGNGVAMKVAPIGALLALGRMAPNDVLPLAVMTHATASGIAAGIAQAVAINECLQTDPDAFDGRDFSMRLTNNIKFGVHIGVKHAQRCGFPSTDIESFMLRINQLEEIGTQNAACPALFYLDRLSCETVARVFGANGFHAADSLPTTWAFFLRSPRSIGALYDVVNAGGDSDSNGAMCGALLGALNGTSIIPQYLIDQLWMRERVVKTAENLCDVLGIFK